MTNIHTNFPEAPEVDRLQAAALKVLALRKEQEAAELAKLRQPAPSQGNVSTQPVKPESSHWPEPNQLANEESSESRQAAPEARENEAENDSRVTEQLPEQAREFGLLTRADVRAQPAPIPLIHGMIAKGQLAMIAGPSGSGKSVFQLHLGAALLNADQVFGHTIPARARFLYVNLEGELKRRLEAVEKHHPGWSFPAPDAIFLTRQWRLNVESEVIDLAQRVNEAGGVDVIFIDTLNRATPGCDENLSSDMGVVIAHANLLTKLTGAAVVLTHHTGKTKDKGPRGHSSLYAALDTCLMVDRSESGIRTVELNKVREMPDGKKYYFTIENIDLGEDDYGLPVVGPALTEVEGTPEIEKAAATPELTPNQKQAFLAISLHMQNCYEGEQLKEISYDDALEAVKTEFSAMPSKHRSTRAREFIDALVECGQLRQSDGGMLSIGA